MALDPAEQRAEVGDLWCQDNAGVLLTRGFPGVLQLGIVAHVECQDGPTLTRGIRKLRLVGQP